ncbi:MAG: hypothetical protein JNJ54_01305 [Myxococcaceae bacterium]|nr:hypothetical protein [Myxococcaceae bacterium]
MGFSVQLTLVQGRPDVATITRWANAVRARPAMRGPVLCAAPDWSGTCTVFSFDVSRGAAPAPALEPAEHPRVLPPLPPDHPVGEADQFLTTLALVAREERLAAASPGDSSISDCGQLFVPGGRCVRWDETSCDEGRAEADVVLKELFGEGPSIDDLDWAGTDQPFWLRRLG